MIIFIVSLMALVSGIFVVGLGLFVFYKNHKSKLNIIFLIMSLVIGIWLVGTYKMLNSQTNTDAIFWDRFIYVGVILVPTLMYHFSWIFTKASKQKIILISGYLFSFIFLLISRTNLFVNDLFYYRWGVHTQARLFHHIFLLFFFIYLFLTLRLFYIYYKEGNLGNTEKMQAKYVFFAFFILIAIGSTAYAPAYKINIPPFSFLSGLIFTVILSYAILKYRLMDIRVVIKRSTIFSGVVIAVTAFYTLTAFLLSQTSQIFVTDAYSLKSQIIIGLIVAIFVALGFRPLYEWLKKVTDVFLFKGEYQPQELMADISNVLSRTLDLERVVQILQGKITRALRLNKMRVIILKESRLKSSLQKSIERLTGHFKRQKETLVLEELEKKYADKIKFDQGFLLIKGMRELGAALATPLFLKEKLIGFFFLDTKKSGDIFTNEDIQTLEAIANQAAIAIENARLYDEMKDFSKTLQKEVDYQTKTLKRANIKLNQLDRAKSEFVSLASHQLRTPLTAIKGYISMIIEGVWGEINLEQKKYLERVYDSNERLIRLVEDLLIVSRIESGRLEFNLQMVSLEKIVQSVIEELKPLADKKNLYLQYKKHPKPLPKIKIDSLKIRQVIINLIDNAIHYTEKGGITIKIIYQPRKKTIVFSITDTGIGITEREKITLFEKFSRGKDVSKIHTDGTGLGLYLAAKLINAHHGKIWVESKGEGKGSTFYFKLKTKIIDD